jgi:acetoin utilization deacetylase AcuC-like enzyme
VMDRLALPAIRAFRPDLILVACGFDAGLNDPLGRMMATAETFRLMTRAVAGLAADLGARLAMVHEGGYSETYVPFCGHAVLEELSGADIAAPDPFADTFARRQPGPAFDAFVEGWIGDLAAAL